MHCPASRRPAARPRGYRGLQLGAIFLLIVTNTLVVAGGPARAASPFVDVAPDDPAYTAINELYTRGVIKGYPTNPPTFGPGDLSLDHALGLDDLRGPAWALGAVAFGVATAFLTMELGRRNAPAPTPSSGDAGTALEQDRAGVWRPQRDFPFGRAGLPGPAEPPAR